jgi:hypothetical protein
MKFARRNAISLVGTVVAGVLLAVGLGVGTPGAIPLICEGGGCSGWGQSCGIGTVNGAVACYCYEDNNPGAKCSFPTQ